MLIQSQKIDFDLRWTCSQFSVIWGLSFKMSLLKVKADCLHSVSKHIVILGHTWFILIFVLYTWTKCLPISFYMTGVCIISVSMAAGVPRRGRLSSVIALVQDTVELRAITVGLRNGFLHFKHTYCSFIMYCSLSKFP